MQFAKLKTLSDVNLQLYHNSFAHFLYTSFLVIYVTKP